MQKFVRGLEIHAQGQRLQRPLNEVTVRIQNETFVTKCLTGCITEFLLNLSSSSDAHGAVRCH
jgi:hypothetical protein